MYFPDKHAEVIYILFYIKIHIGNDVDSVHYFCDVLYYNTVTWCNFDDYTITKYLGYPENVYDNLSKENEQKRGDFYYEWIR